jgi:oligopeptide transport system substrate-binding protein
MGILRGLLVLGLTVYACSCSKRQSPAAEGVRTQTLHIGNGAEVATFDPHVANLYTDYNVLIALYEGLTALDESSSKPVPGAAESWNLSDDGLIYTFRLRHGATWSNGDPVTAHDFAFSIQRVLSPKIASPYANLLDPLKGARAYYLGTSVDFSSVGVRVVDDRTLVLELEKPTPYFLDILGHQALFPVHPASTRKAGDPFARASGNSKPEDLVVNGAFAVERWEPDQRLILKKNPRYYGASGNRLERVVIYPISNAKVEESNFRTGQLHVTYELLPDRLDSYRRENPAAVRVDPLLDTFFIRFNITRPPFNDRRVRQAFARAIDREAIAKSVMRGSRIAAYHLTPPSMGGYTSSARVEADYERARQLLAESGFPGGKGFPRVELMMNTDSNNRPIFEAVQAMWRRELGVEVALTQLDDRVYLSNQQNLAYDLIRSRWVADYNDPTSFLDLFASNSGNNQTGWKNARYDELVDRASREASPGQRFQLLQEAEALLLEEAPMTPLFFGTRTYLISPQVKGWVPSVLGIRRYQTVWLE